MAEVDERYKRGMIYTIRNYTDDTLIYVGSTINTLSKRFNGHKVSCKAGNNVTLYSHIDNNDWTDWYIELYEAYSCNNKNELDRREGEVIREIGTINKCIAGRTKKEYIEENIDKYKEYHKKYREDNVEKIKERHKKYREDNVEKIKEQKVEYYKQNVDKIKEREKERYEQNVEKMKEYQKEYYENNANKIKEKRKEKVCCSICGILSRKGDLAKHQKTKKCMSKNLNNTDIPNDIHI